MRATLKRYFDALIARREEGKDKGFSLIELIVVVAILGILVAIAIPTFGGIQGTAQDNALKATAANGAMAVAAVVADGKAASTADLATLVAGDITAVTLAQGTTLADICVSAAGFGKTKFAGNGAKPDGSACA